MNLRTLNQKGSDSRDLFKWLHKQILPGNYYALNSDLELVEKVPIPFVVARLDFKLGNDCVSFTEAISYNQFVNAPMPNYIPVYIIETDRAFVRVNETEQVIIEAQKHHRFDVYKYIQADWRPNPPKIEKRLLRKGLDWNGLKVWEGGLREFRKKQMAQYIRETKE